MIKLREKRMSSKPMKRLTCHVANEKTNDTSSKPMKRLICRLSQ